MDRVDELTRKDLIKGLDSRTKKYSKKVKQPVYKGITKDYTIIFDVPSATTSGVFYTVKINLSEYESLKNDTDLSTNEKLRLCIDGDVKISCNCPAAKFWGYDYILSQLAAKEGFDEDRYPTVRNPQLDGTLCKHAYVAVRYLGRLWKKISKDIDSNNFIGDDSNE